MMYTSIIDSIYIINDTIEKHANNIKAKFSLILLKNIVNVNIIPMYAE